MAMLSGLSSYVPLERWPEKKPSQNPSRGRPPLVPHADFELAPAPSMAMAISAVSGLEGRSWLSARYHADCGLPATSTTLFASAPDARSCFTFPTSPACVAVVNCASVAPPRGAVPAHETTAPSTAT